MKLIIGGVLARAQRDNKIDLSEALFMSNHAHMIATVKDPQQLINFYQEVQKKLTDIIKKLLGIEQLNLWEGRPVIEYLPNVEDVTKKIAYLYSNPARANLIDTVSDYPGFSTYNDFISASNNIDATVVRKEYWLPSSRTPLLPARSMKHHQAIDFAQELKELAIEQELELKPNSWMKSFGISEEHEVKEIRLSIMASIAANEAAARELRVQLKKGILGIKALRTQEIMRAHKPAKSVFKSFISTMCNETRMAFIKQYNAICDICRECYEKAKLGLVCEWPPGIFRPTFGHVASALDW